MIQSLSKPTLATPLKSEESQVVQSAQKSRELRNGKKVNCCLTEYLLRNAGMMLKGDIKSIRKLHLRSCLCVIQSRNKRLPMNGMLTRQEPPPRALPVINYHGVSCTWSSFPLPRSRHDIIYLSSSEKDKATLRVG